MRDHYETLGIGRDATQQEIKSAYRKLALQYHPDRNGNSQESAEKFRQINLAYSALMKSQEPTAVGDRMWWILRADLREDLFGDFFGVKKVNPPTRDPGKPAKRPVKHGKKYYDTQRMKERLEEMRPRRKKE